MQPMINSRLELNWVLQGVSLTKEHKSIPENKDFYSSQSNKLNTIVSPTEKFFANAAPVQWLCIIFVSLNFWEYSASPEWLSPDLGKKWLWVSGGEFHKNTTQCHSFIRVYRYPPSSPTLCPCYRSIWK